MIKTALILLACALIVGLAFAAFHFFGRYSFLLILVITIAGLIRGVGKPKFGKKK